MITTIRNYKNLVSLNDIQEGVLEDILMDERLKDLAVELDLEENITVDFLPRIKERIAKLYPEICDNHLSPELTLDKASCLFTCDFWQFNVNRYFEVNGTLNDEAIGSLEPDNKAEKHSLDNEF